MTGQEKGDEDVGLEAELGDMSVIDVHLSQRVSVTSEYSSLLWIS
jgi:hypothetical protein